MLATVEGVYRNGKIELAETPDNLSEGTLVIVTFMPKRLIDLKERGISEAEAADLRARLFTFREEWESLEMDIYDDYDRIKATL